MALSMHRKLHAASLSALALGLFSLVPLLGLVAVPMALLVGIRAFVFLGLHPEYYGRRFLFLAFALCFGGVVITTQLFLNASGTMVRQIALLKRGAGAMDDQLPAFESLVQNGDGSSSGGFLGMPVNFTPAQIQAAQQLADLGRLMYPERFLSKAIRKVSGVLGVKRASPSVVPVSGLHDMRFSEQEAFIDQIEKHFRSREYSLVVNACNVSLQRVNENMLIYWQRARAFAAMGQYDRSLRDYERALNLAQKEGRRAMVVWLTRAQGEVCAALGNYAQALVYFERYILLKKDMVVPEDRVLTGAMYSHLGDHRKAAESFAAAQEMGLAFDRQEERIQLAPGVFRVTRFSPEGRVRSTQIMRAGQGKGK